MLEALILKYLIHYLNLTKPVRTSQCLQCCQLAAFLFLALKVPKTQQQNHAPLPKRDLKRQGCAYSRLETNFLASE